MAKRVPGTGVGNADGRAHRVIYLGLYGAMLIAGITTAGNTDARRKTYGVLLAALYLFVAFRYQVGCDWTGYLNIYDINWYTTLPEALSQREPLFVAANVMLHRFELDYPYINLIAAAVYFFGFHRLARRQPDRLGFLILSFPILVINLAMSAIRQAMAVGVLCLAFNAFVDRRPVRFVGLVFLAAMLHTSALIFLALTPLVFGRLSRTSILIGSAVALPGAYFLATGEDLSIFYQRYAGAGTDAAGAPFRTAMLALTGVLYFGLMQSRWRQHSPNDYKLVTIGAAMMVPTFLIAFFSSVIGDRFGYYILPIQLMILARVPMLLRGAFSPAVLGMPYLAIGLALAVWTVVSSLFTLCYLPYRSWLFGPPAF